MPKVEAIHQSIQANSTKAMAIPIHRRGDRRQYQAQARNIAKAENAPGRNQVPGTGMVHSKALTDQTIGGTHSRWIHWLVALRWSAEYWSSRTSIWRMVPLPVGSSRR